MRTLRDRVAVVTGAASGIGAATAQLLAEKGCHVALADIDEAGLASVAERIRAGAPGRRVSCHRVDVASRDRMRELPNEVLAEHGAVHVLVNNAGVSSIGSVEDHSLDDLEWLMGINFWGVVHGCKFFLPHLRAQEEAHIVNVSSMFGFVGLPRQSAYCCSKAAVRALSEALWAELAETSVTVTSVHPGGVRTSIVRSSRTDRPEEIAETQRMFDRFARPPEHAARSIVGAIEGARWRVRIGAESFVADWLKRLMPVATHRLVAFAHRRGEAKRRSLAG